MRTLTVMEMNAVAGGHEEEKSFVENLAQCAADTMTGAAIGAGTGAATGAGAVGFAIAGAIIFNLASKACNALP